MVLRRQRVSIAIAAGCSACMSFYRGHSRNYPLSSNEARRRQREPELDVLYLYTRSTDATAGRDGVGREVSSWRLKPLGPWSYASGCRTR